MIKQFVPESICLKCLGCCRFREADSVWLPCLLDEEIQDLLDRKIPPAAISINRKIQPIPNSKQDGFICPFLNMEGNICQIYSFRPFECQLYPFLIALRDKQILLTVDLNCPYIKENLNSKELEKYTDYLVSFLNSPPQIKILKNNPQIIQAYQEILDLVELKFTDEAE